ncbi:Phosphotyrosyl phosphatase activator [Coprinellus micaceus]|uniref:Serine/threonine-protein phosphatase 2A activator n=1 Tax=Coprinellus micaceus TaxID=71717 RepID=A0A4Y7TG33_COPMI|nr:Phosphotyrosyl phosphatase activator [Coprinellus micaceus]
MAPQTDAILSSSTPSTVPQLASASGFQPPNKRILTPEQLVAFQQSPTHGEIVEFIDELNVAVKGVKLRDGEGEVKEIPIIQALLKIWDKVESIAKDTPPVPNAASRFGNPAFRDFYDKVGEASTSLHETHLVPLGLPSSSIPEIRVYFSEMWGNRTRIDYGSGMELNWLCWILCLRKLGLFPDPSLTNKFIVTRVFWRYISVMRVLQSTYWLEPAGSHGVWGLDDYHFLPFLWGSGQLVGHKWIRPRAIHDAEVVEEYGGDWMYFACIAFINSIKTASLRWHSPMLDDISAVKTWDKVNSGMKKMYLAEVLGKLPVMQHFLFGSLLPSPTSPVPPPSASDALPGEGEEGDTGGAGQREVGWGDCCGIPVPSVFGAAQAESGQGQSGQGQVRGGYTLSGVRPVPFD